MTKTSSSVSQSVSVTKTSSSSLSVSVTKSSSSSSRSLANQDYSRESGAALRANDDQLNTVFSGEDYVTVATDDGQYVDQQLTDAYATFLFKDLNPTQQEFTVAWNGQSTLAPSSATVYLQVYDRVGETWETLDSDNLANAGTDFDLTGHVTENLGNYYDGDGYIACRVYQQEA